MSKILLTGATGFIGHRLVPLLREQGHELILLTRRPTEVQREVGPDVLVLRWNGIDISGWVKPAEGCDVILNLLGENIGSGRWTSAKLARIRGSRLQAGQAVIEAVKSWDKKPEMVVQASAIGYYGNRAELIDEQAECGSGMISDLTRDWEKSTQEVESAGVKRAVLRIGVVFGRGGGVLGKLILPFRLGLGGPLGKGSQGVSWIHIDDVVLAMDHIIRNRLDGVFNLTAPEPVSMRQFTRQLSTVMHRPHWLYVPEFMIRLMLGKMADELLLSGARVFPGRLLDSGYYFKYNTIDSALRHILSRQ